MGLEKFLLQPAGVGLKRFLTGGVDLESFTTGVVLEKFYCRGSLGKILLQGWD